MARVEIVDYEKIPGQANEMRGEAKQLNSEMNKAYTSIKNMHEVWYGIRYNELVKAFNNMIPSLNEMLTLVVTEIPYALETIANNYSQADRGQNAVAASNEAPNKITDLAITNDVGMRFLTSNVQEVQDSVSVNFKNAKDLMDKIETIYAKITWDSEASEAFKAKFTKLKNEIVTSFEDINTQFKKLMDQTLQDMDAAETANTVN